VYNLVNNTNLVHNIFLSVFISFLYMFRATVYPSSGEITVPMRHLVFVTLCGWLSGMQGGMNTVTYTISRPIVTFVILRTLLKLLLFLY